MDLQDKITLAQLGVEMCKEFLLDNELVVPKFSILTPEDRYYHVNSCGFYRAKLGVHVMPQKCANLGVAGRNWSWPGHWIDRTPYGVVAHEVGHHVHHFHYQNSNYVKDESGEKKLTNYCPNDLEWFAEMFRLFLTNPDLLRLIRPRTFGLLAEEFNCISEETWQQVLHDAPERHIKLIKSKIKE